MDNEVEIPESSLGYARESSTVTPKGAWLGYVVPNGSIPYPPGSKTSKFTCQTFLSEPVNRRHGFTQTPVWFLMQ